MKIRGILFVTCLTLLGCNSDDQQIDASLSCEHLLELYPNTNPDSCNILVKLLKEYPIPEELPPKTTTGTYTLGAELWHSSGETELIVAEGIEGTRMNNAWCFGCGRPANCYPFDNRFRKDDGYLEIWGIRCSRGPILDGAAIGFRITLDSLENLTDSVILTYRPFGRSYYQSSTHESIDGNDVQLSVDLYVPEFRHIAGTFSGTVYRKTDTLDSIRIIN